VKAFAIISSALS
jgi:hypothetical protein